MDEFGEFIAETLQRLHDEEQKAKEIDRGAGVHVPGRTTSTSRAGVGHGRDEDAAFQANLARAHGAGRLRRRSTINHRIGCALDGGGGVPSAVVC